jgi:hypothetical protein
MFPVRYELNSYINFLRNSVFKGLNSSPKSVGLNAMTWYLFFYKSSLRNIFPFHWSYLC